jgi:hypothetical protein
MSDYQPGHRLFGIGPSIDSIYPGRASPNAGIRALDRRRVWERPIIMHREKGWTSLPTLELLLTWLACLIEALTACSRVGKKKGLGSVKKPCQDTVELQRFIDHRQVPTVWYDFQP